MFALVASHLMAALVGIGMSVLVFACVKIASYMNHRAASSAPVPAFAWHSSRFLVGLICAAAIAVPWLYLLVEIRESFTVVACLLASASLSAYLFVKYQVFGQVTALRW